jgi:hypothetical protein
LAGAKYNPFAFYQELDGALLAGMRRHRPNQLVFMQIMRQERQNTQPFLAGIP